MYGTFNLHYVHSCIIVEVFLYTEIYVICASHKLEMRKEAAQEWRIVRKIRFFTRKICALHKLEMR